MRAIEFITEEKKLPPEQADPMNHVFVLPGVKSSDPYQIYRFGVLLDNCVINLQGAEGN